MELLQYPSVTVCVYPTFKDYIDDRLFSSNSSLAETEKLLKSNIWKRNETFYFVNHKHSTKNYTNREFPCMTSSESNDPGRPCSFPFKLRGTWENKKVYYNCSPHLNPNPWCYTKVDKEGNFIKVK